MIISVTASAYQTSSQTPPTTATSLSPTHASVGNSLSKGTIAGIAIGGAAGTFIVFAIMMFFIFRHRKQAKQSKAVLQDDRRPTEKAQLDSTEYKPHREELEGSKGVRKIRQVGGLNEMEHNPMLQKVTSEMSANEIAAAEVNSSATQQSSTLLGSSTRDTDSRY